MPDYPLLLFPKPEAADRTKRPSSFPRGVHRPEHGRQGRRLSPIFENLQKAVKIQQTAAGVDPEQVLVIETIGSVGNFINAVKKIPDLEWLSEIEVDDIEPDEDFYNEEDREKLLKGRIYLIMSNQKALRKMLSLWRRYQKDERVVFERGQAKFKEVFKWLRNIRRWDVEDRLDETGLLNAWEEDLKYDQNRPVRFEVELWFRAAKEKRRNAKERIETLVSSLNGMVLSSCVIDDISYHALLAEIPAGEAENIIEHQDVDLIKSDEVMFVRPVGQMTTGKYLMEENLSSHKLEQDAVPEGDPIIAILDGLPLENHELLQNRLIIDDPDNYASEYPVSNRAHGTAMASLVVHGDLNDGTSPLSRPVYVRPVMKPVQSSETPSEALPRDVLMVDYIHRAVRRIFEGEGSTPAIAPTIRVINFSIGDRCRQFTRALSPLARLLDWLSVKYPVLFVVSAGNHQEDIKINMPTTEFNRLSDEEKEKQVVKALYEDERKRRILAPSESINSIAVGAFHHDASKEDYQGSSVDLFKHQLPSPISAFGGGYRRSVKPDLLFNGGRVLYREIHGNNPDTTFQISSGGNASGNRTATLGRVSGKLNGVKNCCGTSNAAALTSRTAAICHDTLLEIFKEQKPEDEPDRYITSLIKAMVVHGCSWGEIRGHLKAALQPEIDGRDTKKWISRWLGYGVPDHTRVLACTAQRATVLGYGELLDEGAHLFGLPLPPSLSAQHVRRRLTVTLAWISPVAVNTQAYRSTQLWFEVNDQNNPNVVETSRREIDNNTSRRGTVQHEVFEGSKSVAIVDDGIFTIKVNCRKDAEDVQKPVTYGLAVTLEIVEGVDIPIIGIPIYEEIRERIAPRVGIGAPENE